MLLLVLVILEKKEKVFVLIKSYLKLSGKTTSYYEFKYGVNMDSDAVFWAFVLSTEGSGTYSS